MNFSGTAFIAVPEKSIYGGAMGRFLRIYRNFSGGLSEAANDNMGDDQLTEARNIVPGDGFGIAKACGVVPAYPRIPVTQANSNRVVRLLEFKPVEGDAQLLAFVSVPTVYEDIYRYRADSNDWLRIAENERAVKDWFIFGGKLYYLNGSSLRCYDGTDFSDVSINPQGSTATAAENSVWSKVKKAIAVEQRGHRWFYATKDNEVIFSEVGDPASIDPTSIINVNTKNGDSITALHEFNDGLLIFKKHSIHYLQGWDMAGGSDVRLQQLNVSSGTVFPRSVCTVDNGVIYLGSNGLYRLTVPDSSTIVAAKNISEGRISKRLYAKGQILEAVAAVWENTYYLSVRKQITDESGQLTGTADYEYRYLVAKNSFLGEFTMPTFSYAIDVGGQSALFIGSNNGYVLRYDRNSYHYIDTDTGEALPIDARARSKCYDVAGSMAQEVRLNRVEIAARQFMEESSDFSVQLKADYGDYSWDASLKWASDTDDGLIYGEGLLGIGLWGWQDTVTKELLVRRRCTRLQFIISDESDQPLLIYGLALLYRKKRLKGSRRGVVMSNE